jgi:HSP20 family molecular chaperone IbpA
MSRVNNPADRMWADACALLAQAERMHQQFFRLASPARVQASWEPPVDIVEDEREVVIVVAMPGVPAERVEVFVEPGLLVIRGERPVPFAQARHAVRQLEIPYGLFERRIPLNGARFESGTHQLVNGCVVLRLTKLV